MYMFFALVHKFLPIISLKFYAKPIEKLLRHPNVVHWCINIAAFCNKLALKNLQYLCTNGDYWFILRMWRRVDDVTLIGGDWVRNLFDEDC